MCFCENTSTRKRDDRHKRKLSNKTHSFCFKLVFQFASSSIKAFWKHMMNFVTFFLNDRYILSSIIRKKLLIAKGTERLFRLVTLGEIRWIHAQSTYSFIILPDLRHVWTVPVQGGSASNAHSITEPSLLKANQFLYNFFTWLLFYYLFSILNTPSTAYFNRNSRKPIAYLLFFVISFFTEEEKGLCTPDFTFTVFTRHYGSPTH